MQRYLPLCLTIGLLIAFRALGSAFPQTLPNFQPLAALFFCGALMAPGWRGYAIPLGIWLATFAFGSGHTWNPAQFLSPVIAFTAAFFIGQSLSKRSIPTLLLGSVASALIFHLMTSAAAWMLDPRYVKSLEGLVQSVWTGVPGDVLPSWVFLRNLTAANLIFTAIFLAARVRLPKPTMPVMSVPATVKSR